MKAILEFNPGENRESDQEFRDALDGSKWRMLVGEYDEWLRRQIKYAPDTMTQEKYDALVEAREMLRSMMNERGLDTEY